MNHKLPQKILFTCFSFIFFACSDDVTNVTENHLGVLSFESVKNFPDCKKENLGEMAIAKDEGLVYYCNDSTWITLNGIDGKDGKNGINGKDGKNGVDGKDGSKGETGNAGKDGQDGENCTAKKIEKGIEVSCGDNVIGIIEHGTDGKDGDFGKNGEDGTGCSIMDNGDGTITIKCGDESSDLIKAICGSKPYDPIVNFCFENKLYDYCDGSVYNPNEFVCKENLLKEYITDTRDGQKYSITTIGNQIWMAENLNYRLIFKDENGLPVADSGSYCYGDNGGDNRGNENCEKYGRLYTWAAAMDSVNLAENGVTCGNHIDIFSCDEYRVKYQGICPDGFYLPENSDVFDLYAYVNSHPEDIMNFDGVGTKLKATTDWNTYTDIAYGKDIFGFTALPGGRYLYGLFENIKENASFWTTSEENSDNAHYFSFSHDVDDIMKDYTISKASAFSIRCLKLIE